MEKNNKNKAIKIKLANLIAPTPKDSCIKCRVSNFTLDLSKYFNNDQLNGFLNLTIEKLELTGSASKIVLHNDLTNFNNSDDFLNYLQDNEIFIAKTRFEKLKTNFSKYKDETIRLITSKSSGQKRKIDTIVKKNKVISENTGIHSLYIASHFIVGRTEKNTIINAPLILYPIEINVKRDVYTITHNNLVSDNFVVNEKLLSLLANEYKVNLSILDLVQKAKASNDINLIINKVNEILNSSLVFNNSEITSFDDKINYLEIQNFIASNNLVCGIFEPTGGALKYDLEQLIKIKAEPFEDNNKAIAKTEFINQEINDYNIVSIDKPLNIYQKYAIRSALNQNTIIFGPPGTGKSEVIINIIANALLRKSSILIATEKRVALDVIVDRLGPINQFAIFISNLKNKQEFYQKIIDIADQLENKIINHVSYDLVISNMANSKKVHDELFNHFKNISTFSNKTDSNGLYFSDYLHLLSKVDEKLITYFRKNMYMVHYLENMLYSYAFNSLDSLFEELNKFRRFLIVNKIDFNYINELKVQKQELTKLDIEYNFINFYKYNQHNISLLKNEFLNFLELNNLIRDRKFINLIKTKPSLLKKQWALLNKLKQYKCFNSNLLNYLITYFSKVKSFVAKNKQYKTTTQFDTLISDFLKNTKFQKYTSLELNDYNILELFNVFEIFITIDEPENKYLLNLLEISNPSCIDSSIILMHFNEWLNASYIYELASSNWIFFKQDELVNLAELEFVDQNTFNIIRKVINYADQMIVNNPILNTSTNLMIENYKQFMTKDADLSANWIADYYLSNLKETLNNLDTTTLSRIREMFSIARRESKKTAPIKEFIKQYYKELKIIFPIWISLPELIAQMLPLEQNIFDYGIFDEASQIFIERSYPIVYRCKNKIVSGDDKQLKPTSFFATRIDDEIQDYDFSDNDQVDSLLDRAKVALWTSYNLRNHYRSIHRDLIEFSNNHIYNNQLEFVNKNGNVKHAIETIDVLGSNEEGINKVEAETVYELLKSNIEKYNKIIVVTFGIKQSMYIEQIIYKNINEQPLIYNKFMNGELIVCSLENVQGNEGDLVILSITYGKDALGNFKSTFGPIFMDGGINRLNVAITRAKEYMYIVKSFYANEMSINFNNQNAKVFYEFINHCDLLTHKELVPELISTQKYPPTIINNQVEQIINSHLITRPELYIVKNYDLGSKIIDFAILDKNTNETKLAIIFNRLVNNSNISNMFETLDHYYFIQDRGYNTYFLEEYYWISNNENARKQLKALLNTL